ncbi:MAG: response regulator [Deltaproteobacteria bacterium]|jgi:twitching motility two-component system response regulator PilH|nr:response regulator [Deltaproteobacteria bacterium]
MAKKVLNVEDDADTRTFVSTVLEENGYIPIMAVDGEEGMKKVKKERPDLIILDILMPRESGIKMYHELKLDPNLKDIPVAMLSGVSKRTFLRSQAALTEFGDETVPEPQAYLEKPVEPEDLAETLKKILG